MSRKLVISWLGILALLAFLIILPFFLWNQMDETPLNVWIIDKTNDTTQYKGMIWVLNSQKIVSRKTGQQLSYSGQDTLDQLSQTAGDLTLAAEEKPELIYLADAARRFWDDKIGLSNDEVNRLKSLLGDGNTIVGEYDIFNADNQKNLEEIFRVAYTGWKGCYFKHLEKGQDVSDLIVENYQKQTGQDWHFAGSGLILVSDQDQILVLRDGVEMGKNDVRITFADNNSMGITGDFNCEKWFELTSPQASAEVLASFELDVTEEGQKILDQAGLKTSYSAICTASNASYRSCYFSGDFAQMDFSGKLWNYYGFSDLKYLLSKVNPNADTRFYWGAYVPVMENILSELQSAQSQVVPVIADTEIKINVRTEGSGFQIYQDGQWEDFFIKGVNLGSSVPGKWFTEFTYDESLYLSWFEEIAGMNANTIRVYTLLPPQFYSALVYFNEHHPDQTLWLCQEIWPEENPEEHDYLKEAYNISYQQEIKIDLDALHGQADIPERTGRAYGYYTADVSPYVIGYLVGRELEPEEVIATNTLHSGESFSGNYLSTTAEASPTESWLAMSCDYVADYEEKTYGWQHPVGIVSWPTLDVAEHDSEWNEAGDKSLQYNDKVSVDINHIDRQEKLTAGFFGGYHIYPNYPDFMNNEESYAAYQDEEGSFRYGGYLQEFIAGHSKYPAVVAEFGMATGMGTAHQNPDGYDHGGVTESEQGQGIVRMMKAIDREGYAGGIIFQWSDEWAKKTWITEPYMIPYQRQALWHNSLDPEQNYGIMAMESAELKSDPYEIIGTGELKSLSMAADEAYLYLNLELDQEIDFSKKRLLLGLDTVNRDLGDQKFSPDIEELAASGMEYVIEINSQQEAKLLVQPQYNFTTGHFMPVASQSGVYEAMSMLINKETLLKSGAVIAPVYQDLSTLKVGSLTDNSYYQIDFSNQTIAIRLPWTLIGVSDPSSQQVLYDSEIILNPLADVIKTTSTDGFLAYGVLAQKENGESLATIGLNNQKAFSWRTWDVPDYQERLKASYQIIGDYFGQLKE